MIATVPVYWERVLQGLVYWVAYKKQYYNNHLLTEGAIVAELTQLLSSKIDTNQLIECERMYKNFTGSINDNSRIDIIIGKKPTKYEGKNKFRLCSKSITEIVEVKRYEGQFTNIQKDFEKLAQLKKMNKSSRLFQVVIGQQKLPDKIFTEKHNVRRKNIYEGNEKIEARPRIGKKAYSSKTKSENGVFAVLIEVL